MGLRHPSLVASAAPLGICGSPPPLHRETKKLELAFVPPLLRSCSNLPQTRPWRQVHLRTFPLKHQKCSEFPVPVSFEPTDRSRCSFPFVQRMMSKDVHALALQKWHFPIFIQGDGPSLDGLFHSYFTVVDDNWTHKGGGTTLQSRWHQLIWG